MNRNFTCIKDACIVIRHPRGYIVMVHGPELDWRRWLSGAGAVYLHKSKGDQTISNNQLKDIVTFDSESKNQAIQCRLFFR